MRQRLVMALLATVAIGALAACPTPKVPKGPPPEYEDPPAPSWIDAGTPSEASAPVAPAAPPVSTLPVD